MVLLTAVAMAFAAGSAGSAVPRTFGKGIPNHPFTNSEVEIFNETLNPTDTIGTVNHFWSTACGGKENFVTDAGVTIYRYYIDGESEASVVFTPRMATGGYFDPVPPGNSPGPAPGPNKGNGTASDYVVGGKGQSCDEACKPLGRICSPDIVPAGATESELGVLFQSLLPFDDTGITCAIDPDPWWAHDQPSYVWAINNTNYGKCLGLKQIPPAGLVCNGSHPLVQRLCRCTPAPAGIADAVVAPLGVVEATAVPGEDNAISAEVPWGTELIGKTSDMDGYYVNFQVPFYKSLRVTAQLPPGHGPFDVYTIVRGTVNVPIVVNGFTLPATAKMVTERTDAVAVPSLHFVPIVNRTTGSGLVLGHTVAISGEPSFTYLEGCFHLLTPYSTPLVANGLSGNFPGITLSTGMEDYYDSAFYFHAGIFQLPASGVVHMCSGLGSRASTPHPSCTSSKTSQWSAYRMHNKDPLFFSDGAQLVFRNGDVAGRVPYGTAKCYNLDMNGGPGSSTVSTLAWLYTW